MGVEDVGVELGADAELEDSDDVELIASDEVEVG